MFFRLASSWREGLDGLAGRWLRLLRHAVSYLARRVQDVDRPAHVEALAQPARASRSVRVSRSPLRLVLRPERPHGSLGHVGERGTSGRGRPSGRRNASAPSGLSLDLVALLVDGAVVPATEQARFESVVGPPWPSGGCDGPGRTHAAAREAAAAVPMMERAPQRRRNRAGPGPDLHDAAVGVVAHDHPARVARQAARRFRGNARRPPRTDWPGRSGVGQHGGIDVDHDLVALARGARVEAVVEGRLGEQRQGVRLLLRDGRRFRGSRPRSLRRAATAGALVQRLAAASSACTSRAPTSGASRPRTTTVPSSSW